MSKGFFLSVEGLGGSGKTGLCGRIEQYCIDVGLPYIRTFEPGGTPAANFLRKLCREGIPDCEALTPMAEVMLFNAARAQHVETVIKPALEAGKVVICDRYLLSTMMYQGIAGGVSLYTIDKIHHDAIGLKPDYTIIMTGDPEVFARRILPAEKASDKFDSLQLATNERIQDYLDGVAKSGPEFFPVDAEQMPNRVFEQVEPLMERIYATIQDRKEPRTPSIKIPPKTRSSVLDRIIPGKVEFTGIKDT